MRSKKISGDGHLIAALISLLVITILIMYSLAFNQDFASKQALDSICREYIIKLETLGNISSIEVNNMQNEIKNRITSDLGDKVDTSSISVIVTPNTYGKDISIAVSCRVRIEQNKFIDGFTFNENEGELYDEYRRTITSTSTN